MENWKDYVSYQPVDKLKDEKFGLLFYIKCNFGGIGGFDEKNEFNFSINKEQIDISLYTIKEQNVGECVESVLNSFPTKIKNDNPYAILRARNRVAADTRRGTAKTNFGNIWFYRGASSIPGQSGSFDCPVIVSSYQDKYYIWKHPDFDKYGFIMED